MLPTFGPKTTAAQEVGKEWSDVIQAAIAAGPDKFTKIVTEGIEAITKTAAFAALMQDESNETATATFDVKAAAYHVALGAMMDNGAEFFSLDS